MRKTTVMQVIECGGPGGTGNQTAALCNGLDRERFDVHLVYAVRPGSTPAEYERLARGAAVFHHIPEMTREISPLDDIAAWWRLYKLFRELRPDVVHAQSSKAGFLARTAGWAAGVPRILYSPRGYAFQQTDRCALSRCFYRSLERSVSWIGDIAAVSEGEAALARELAEEVRVRVVRDAFLGELPPPRTEAKPEGPVTVCAAGRMSFPRNPEAFVRLARRLTLARSGVRCLWIGGGELEEQVKSQRETLRLSRELELTGWLPHAQAVSRLRAADIFVHYSRWEGLPNAVIEAMAHGLPVVASDIPGNRDAVSDGVNGFLASDENEVLSRTLQLARDPELRARLGANGRERVREEFSLERMLREYSSLYETST